MFKKNFLYLNIIFFGIIDEISNLALFALPIKAIKIIDNGTVPTTPQLVNSYQTLKKNAEHGD